MLKIALAKALTVKAAAVAAVVVGGGVALAATGVVPNPLGNSGKPAASHSPKPEHSNAAQGQPSPNLEGLCKAYAAKPEGERGKALESPAFQALITEAGGLDKVTEFCTTLLPSAKPTVKPSTPGGGKPSSVPGGGGPSAKPTERPGGPTVSPSRK